MSTDRRYCPSSNGSQDASTRRSAQAAAGTQFCSAGVRASCRRLKATARMPDYSVTPARVHRLIRQSKNAIVS